MLRTPRRQRELRKCTGMSLPSGSGIHLENEVAANTEATSSGLRSQTDSWHAWVQRDYPHLTYNEGTGELEGDGIVNV